MQQNLALGDAVDLFKELQEQIDVHRTYGTTADDVILANENVFSTETDNDSIMDEDTVYDVMNDDDHVIVKECCKCFISIINSKISFTCQVFLNTLSD